MSHYRYALLAVLMLLCVSPAAAKGTGLTAEALNHGEAATHAGALGMLLVADMPGDGETLPWLEIRAASAVGTLFSQSSPAAFVPGTSLYQTFALNDPEPTPVAFEGPLTASMAVAQPDYEVHLYSADGSLQYTATVSQGVLEPIATARMGPGALGDEAYGVRDPDHPTFRYEERPGPWILQDGSGGPFSVAVRGSMVLEVFGLGLEVRDAEGTHRMDTGVWDEPAVAGGPSRPVAMQRTQFLRLHLSDAVVDLSTGAGKPMVAWAASSVDLDPTGPVVLTGAFGELHRDGDVLQLNGQRVALPAGQRLGLTPGETIDVALMQDPAPRPNGFLAEVPAPASAALVGAGAVAALAVAVGLGLLRNVLRRPELSDVERAIEEGSFRKAARLAGRILVRRPRDESVLLGRAIALSKSGRPDQAVREVRAHLRGTPATDGSLHYVLGLAQLELGHAAEGRASLREAARLTPALHAEVAPRLGPSSSKETHGYA